MAIGQLLESHPGSESANGKIYWNDIRIQHSSLYSFFHCFPDALLWVFRICRVTTSFSNLSIGVLNVHSANLEKVSEPFSLKPIVRWCRVS